MKGISKWFYLAILLFVLLLGFATGRDISRGNPSPSHASMQMESFILPPFQLSTLDGRVITHEDLGHGPVVLAFILPNCLACESVIGLLKIASSHFPEAAYFFATKEDSPELRAMLEAFSPFSFPVLLDVDFRLARLFAVDLAPTVYLIRDGIVLKRMTWPFSHFELFSQIEALIQGTLEPVSPSGVRVGEVAPDF